MRDQARQQRRLAGAAPARQTNHLHVILHAGGTGLATEVLYIP
jgi:hypothetical protein